MHEPFEMIARKKRADHTDNSSPGPNKAGRRELLVCRPSLSGERLDLREISARLQIEISLAVSLMTYGRDCALSTLTVVGPRACGARRCDDNPLGSIRNQAPRHKRAEKSHPSLWTWRRGAFACLCACLCACVRAPSPSRHPFEGECLCRPREPACQWRRHPRLRLLIGRSAVLCPGQAGPCPPRGAPSRLVRQPIPPFRLSS